MRVGSVGVTTSGCLRFTASTHRPPQSALRCDDASPVFHLRPPISSSLSRIFATAATVTTTPTVEITQWLAKACRGWRTAGANRSSRRLCLSWTFDSPALVVVNAGVRPAVDIESTCCSLADRAPCQCASPPVGLMSSHSEGLKTYKMPSARPTVSILSVTTLVQ